VGLFLTCSSSGMSHPAEGAEKFFGPILGFVALGLSFLGGICFYAASRINKPPSDASSLCSSLKEKRRPTESERAFFHSFKR